MESMVKDSKNTNEPITLMLLGSGVRFPAFIGALAAIEGKGIKIKRIVGASAGSIIGCIYASGMPVMEMKKIALEVDITIFKDFSLMSMIRGKGLYSGNALEKWVDGLLEGRMFSDRFKIPPFVVATDILNNTPFVFSRSNFPDLKVSKAIRFSFGIPWVYEYKHFISDRKKHIFVDGNLLSGIIEEMFDMFEQDGRSLVLRTISSKRHTVPSSEGFTLKKYLQGLTNIMMHAAENERLKGERWRDTILIFCGDIFPTKFTLSRDERLYLYEQGYQQVKKYIEYKWGI